MEPSYDVVGLGCTAVDDLVYVDEYPPRDAKIPVRRRERQCGGLTATALVAAARLNARCAYAGTLGYDEFSAFAIDCFRKEGICVEHLRQCSETSTIHSTIVVDQTHCTRNIFFDVSRALPPDSLWPPAEVIRNSRVLFVDQLQAEGMLRAARIAREAAVGIVADFELGSGPVFEELLALVDHLILSADFAQCLTGASDPRQAVQALWHSERKTVVVTCGRAGCWYLSNGSDNTLQHQAAFPVQEVDTTGCGDVFHGAYAASLSRGWPVARRIEYASAAAALKAMSRGGQAGAPTDAAVMSFLEQRRGPSGNRETPVSNNG